MAILPRQNLALRNERLSPAELNYSVQSIIDRIIFLRICEDRGIEHYGKLQKTTEGGSGVYKRLQRRFVLADGRYNSGLFHFEAEKSRSGAPDRLTPALDIDDRVLSAIINSLYYPASPYEFSILPAEVLGQVYEQFLGKVIRLTEGHRAKVEEKPEVKKAGGVFYTPSYIVSYIVRESLGKLVEGKSPNDVAELAILDPACGSGSFLIGAYQFLLDWHLDYYLKAGPKKYRSEVFQGPGGSWLLTSAERKRILVNNIYGVDIDAQAVEVTKLSLLLKCLEFTSGEVIDKNKKLFHERALPALEANIQCGDSLVGSDYWKVQQTTLDSASHEDVNPFDWKVAFPRVFAKAGFDVVIGNPPYRLLQPHNTSPKMLDYYRSTYVAADFKIDFFHLFLQRGMSLLKQGGRLGFIIPTTILNNVYAESLRRWMLGEAAIEHVAVARGRVFRDADVHTSVLIFRREVDEKRRQRNRVTTTTDLMSKAADVVKSKTPQSLFTRLPGFVWNVSINEHNMGLVERLRNDYPTLDSIAEINRGLITGNREKYFSPTKRSSRDVPILTGSDISRFKVKEPTEYVLFERPKTSGGCWDPKVHFAPHKIVIRQIGREPTAALLESPLAVTGNIFTVMAGDIELERYLLGILNSSLTAFFWRVMFGDFKDSFPQVTIFSLAQVPVAPLSRPATTPQESVIALARDLTDLASRLDRVSLAHQRSSIEHEIRAKQNLLDEAVFNIYALTEEERDVVRANARLATERPAEAVE